MVNRKRRASVVESFLLLFMLVVFFLVGIRAYITKISTTSALRQTRQYIRDVIRVAYATTDYIMDDILTEIYPEIKPDIEIYDEIKNELTDIGIHYTSITVINKTGIITGDMVDIGNKTDCVIVYYIITDWFGKEHTGVVLAGRTEME